ncbi:Fanconi anemia core complex-associated protein 24 [Patella vulgata]|uniref:Fanconi anemia core complex-associated protein 24 n=1 Tax=Patella vulgata TaxID=6465 RepID=UPI0024A83734|nr:Fanconi anemia core complex-associated protein 24 [Patella vulgata]
MAGVSDSKRKQHDKTGSSYVQDFTETPVRVPYGHIVVSGRWRNTELMETLQSSIPVHFEDSLGVVDFHTSSYTGIIYISEADLISSTSYRRKLAKLRKANKVRGVVIAEKTSVSQQYLSDLQRFANLELGLVLLFVENEQEGAKLLVQMVHVETRNASNLIMKKPKSINIDEAILNTLTCVPKLGDVKAKLILQKYKSLKDICNAPVEDLSEIVGQACAKNIKSFFGS